MLRIDLHNHTNHSPDAATTPEELVEITAALGLDRVAVTDHGRISGALRARELDPERIIVGEELRTDAFTELIGLFLTERIPEGLSVEETVERIHDQGGLVYAPHPFAYPVNARAHGERALAVSDVVEGVNGRAFWQGWNRRARRAARRAGVPVAAGSDAHFPSELGRAWVELPEFAGPDGLVDALAEATIVTERRARTPAHMVASGGLKAYRMLTRRSGPWRPGHGQLQGAAG